MEPDWPTKVELLAAAGPVLDQYPAGGIFKYTYPASSSRPGFTAYWYEGHKEGYKKGEPYMPETPEELKTDGRKLPRTGNLIIGTKGKMLVTGDYWNSPQIIPQAKAEEFVMACQGDKPREFSRSNWAYAGPMTAKIQLGNIVYQYGKPLEISRDGKITNHEDANKLLWREPRKGWGPLEQNV